MQIAFCSSHANSGSIDMDSYQKIHRTFSQPDAPHSAGSSAAFTAASKMCIRDRIVDADKLMSLEKQSYYNSLRADREVRYAQMKESLLNELKKGVFTVFLQPQINLKDKSIIGAEALILSLIHI